MEFYVNNNKVDITLENEKTVGDILRGFETEFSKNDATTIAIVLNGHHVSAAEFDTFSAEPLTPDTKLELTIVTLDDIKNELSAESKAARILSQKLAQLPVQLQAGKDKEANMLIKDVADLIDQFCHTASLTALFPQVYTALIINEKNVADFFTDFAPILSDFEHALEAKDTVLIGDLAEYEISPRLQALADAAGV
jgi:hypothetical protein